MTMKLFDTYGILWATTLSAVECRDIINSMSESSFSGKLSDYRISKKKAVEKYGKDAVEIAIEDAR